VMRGLSSTTTMGRASAIARTVRAPARSGVLHRKCDCGQHTGGGECEECKKKKADQKSGRDPLLQRSALNRGAVNGVPPIVHEVLRSPGQPLDARTRAYFEPRFGQDFSRVRVHSDAKAAESASAVGAAAYAYGNNIVFARNRFSASNEAGRNVLAHELAHVAQTDGVAQPGGPKRVSSPGESSEVEAEAMAERATQGASTSPNAARGIQPTVGTGAGTLARLVGPATTHCNPGTHGVPADPFNTLTAVEDHAKGLAQAASILLALESAAVGMGIKSGTVNQAYQNRFGPPPKSGSGFLNRLTGRVNKTQDAAMQGELDGLSARFDAMVSNFGKKLTYRCIRGAVSLDRCDTHCTGRDASACNNVRTYFLCPSFWALPDNSKATLLIHESFHMLVGFPGHGGKGAGKNLRHAECYASFVSDIFNLSTGTPSCPSPPQ
jgi:Domain of unknown function (DUF4157)